MLSTQTHLPWKWKQIDVHLNWICLSTHCGWHIRMGLVNGITPSSQLPHPVLPIPPDLPTPSTTTRRPALPYLKFIFFSFGILNFLIKFKIILNFRSVKAIIELLGHIKKASHLPGELFGGEGTAGFIASSTRTERMAWKYKPRLPWAGQGQAESCEKELCKVGSWMESQHRPLWECSPHYSIPGNPLS